MRKETKNPNRLCQRTKTPIADYLRARDFKWQRLWKQVGSKLITLFEGEWLSENEFDERYPSKAPVHFFSNPENPNQSKNYSV